MLAPAKLFACAACYGANIDAPMAEGMNWAILTLGVVITTVLGAFLTFLIYAIRRSEVLEAAKQRPAAAAAAQAANWTPPVAGPMLRAEPQN
jgi:Flp pilus assembly protein protease CpaA